VSDAKYRTIFIALGLAFVAVVIGGWWYGSPTADQPVLPGAIEAISPAPGSQVPVQTPVEVDVPVGYRIELFVDGFRVPEDELRFAEGTGVYSWTPTRASVIEWGSGERTVIVRWRRLSGLADEGEYSWTFRVF
jgi:hypothetical protein